MIIGIDGNEANVNRRVGIGEYAYELLRQFYEIQKSKFKSQNDKSKFKIYLKSKPVDDLPRQEVWWKYKIFGLTKLWTQFALPFNLYLGLPRPDVFFSPTHYAPRFSPIPIVISIMDLSYIYFPELFKKSDLYQLRNWTAYSVRNAKKVLTISKASKNDIIKQYQVPEDRVAVTYPGIKKESRIMNQESGINRIRKRYGIEGNFILFVGTLQPRKNISRLIEAFAKIRMDPNDYSKLTRMKKNSDAFGQRIRKDSDLQLVIVGKKGWLYEEILEAPKKFGIEDKVGFLDFVPDEDLPLLYQNAICFVLPSLYEGFGLPVLEAMKHGCPVITSNVSSLPEAGGDAAVYVDPNDTEDIAKKIKKVINDGKLRREMVEKGYEQVKKFSWEKTANETLEVLTQVANNGKSY